MINKVVVIGGSAGSIRVAKAIFDKLHIGEDGAILICLHRLQTDNSAGLREVLQYTTDTLVREPENGEPIAGGTIYLAPPNVHLVVESDFSFSLSTSPLVQYSRPSIDVLFMSAAEVFQEKVVGMLLTGANRDGAYGMKVIKESGGITITQELSDCFIDTMPKAAMSLTQIDHILDTSSLNQWLKEYFNNPRIIEEM